MITQKITVVGAGNVGASVAFEIARKNLCKEVILVDLKDGVAKGKALDMRQMAPVCGFDTRIIGVGTNEYEKTKDSEVVVITAGIGRKPGQSRDDLVGINASIVKEVAENLAKFSPKAKFVVVSNPLDVMTYTAFLASGVDAKSIVGMAGILDSSRYIAFIADELGISANGITAQLLGGHGDTMVPLPRYTSVGGIPVTELLPEKKLSEIVTRAINGGSEIVNLQGLSAWYNPATATVQMVEAIVNDSKQVLSVCALVTGEYGLKDVFLGVPAIIGQGGVEKIIECKLDAKEQELLNASATAIKKVMAIVDDMNFFKTKLGVK